MPVSRRAGLVALTAFFVLLIGLPIVQNVVNVVGCRAL